MSNLDYHLNTGAVERLDGQNEQIGDFERLDGLEENERSPVAFHRSLPGYSPTRLLSCDELAERLGVADLWVKEESNRFGLPAYKILGASWAIYNALLSKVTARARTFEELRLALADSGLTLVAATDGNHGRAVARVARWLGIDSEVYVPSDMSQARTRAISSEGATVHVVAGSYDEAVREAAATSGENRVLVQDTSWPGYEQIPGWIVEGYGTIFHEAAGQLSEAGRDPPDLVLIQIGVGSLAAAATRFYHRLDARPRLAGVEPVGADCLLRSARAGRSVTVDGPHNSSMSGLNCGVPSATSLPVLLEGMDAFLAVADERAYEAMRLLASAGVVAGESGAAGLAGLLEIMDRAELAAALGSGASTRVLIVVTEADTDPLAYERAVGRTSEDVWRTV